eukprot:scaffold457661_cov47-Prasinocladus_malaysianus.AAC.1
MKSVAKGFLAGAIGLVACPVIGACQDGCKGAAYGLGAGERPCHAPGEGSQLVESPQVSVVGAVVLPVAGTVVGATQMVRGVINTPEAITESSKGKIWNH